MKQLNYIGLYNQDDLVAEYTVTENVVYFTAFQLSVYNDSRIKIEFETYEQALIQMLQWTLDESLKWSSLLIREEE